MPTLTYGGGTSGKRTLTLGEADGLSRELTFPAGEPVEVTAKDRDAIKATSRWEEFVEGGAEQPAAETTDAGDAGGEG